MYILHSINVHTHWICFWSMFLFKRAIVFTDSRRSFWVGMVAGQCHSRELAQSIISPLATLLSTTKGPPQTTYLFSSKVTILLPHSCLFLAQFMKEVIVFRHLGLHCLLFKAHMPNHQYIPPFPFVIKIVTRQLYQHTSISATSFNLLLSSTLATRK